MSRQYVMMKRLENLLLDAISYRSFDKVRLRKLPTSSPTKVISLEKWLEGLLPFPLHYFSLYVKVDITFFDFFNNFTKGKEVIPGEFEKFPLLMEHYKRVLSVPEINEWLKKRLVTEF